MFVGELANKEKRDQLWKIYFGEGKSINEQVRRAEIFRVRNIECQVSMNATDDETSKTVASSVNHSSIIYLEDSHRSTMTDYSLFMSNQRLRRRSSIDYQIINEWKAVSDQLKKHDVWPWMIRRRLIRQHLKRRRFQSESIECKNE